MNSPARALREASLSLHAHPSERTPDTIRRGLRVASVRVRAYWARTRLAKLADVHTRARTEPAPNPPGYTRIMHISRRERQVLLYYANGLREGAIQVVMGLTRDQVLYARKRLRDEICPGERLPVIMPRVVAQAYRMGILHPSEIEGGPFYYNPEALNRRHRQKQLRHLPDTTAEDIVLTYRQSGAHRLQSPSKETWAELRIRAHLIAQAYRETHPPQGVKAPQYKLHKYQVPPQHDPSDPDTPETPESSLTIADFDFPLDEELLQEYYSLGVSAPEIPSKDAQNEQDSPR